VGTAGLDVLDVVVSTEVRREERVIEGLGDATVDIFGEVLTPSRVEEVEEVEEVVTIHMTLRRAEIAPSSRLGPANLDASAPGLRDLGLEPEIFPWTTSIQH
jgi:hypothetical protein